MGRCKGEGIGAEKSYVRCFLHSHCGTVCGSAHNLFAFLLLPSLALPFVSLVHTSDTTSIAVFDECVVDIGAIKWTHQQACARTCPCRGLQRDFSLKLTLGQPAWLACHKPDLSLGGRAVKAVSQHGGRSGLRWSGQRDAGGEVDGARAQVIALLVVFCGVAPRHPPRSARGMVSSLKFLMCQLQAFRDELNHLNFLRGRCLRRVGH